MEGDAVERVLRRREHPQRGLEYLVRWRGSDGADDEWFPARCVQHDYADLLAASALVRLRPSVHGLTLLQSPR